MEPKKRGKWTEGKLQNAFRAVHSGTSFASAAKSAGITRTTLMRRLSRLMIKSESQSWAANSCSQKSSKLNFVQEYLD